MAEDEEKLTYRQRLLDALVSLGKSAEQAEKLLEEFSETVRLSDATKTPIDALAQTIIEADGRGIVPPTEKSGDDEYPKNLYQ